MSNKNDFRGFAVSLNIHFYLQNRECETIKGRSEDRPFYGYMTRLVSLDVFKDNGDEVIDVGDYADDVPVIPE